MSRPRLAWLVVSEGYVCHSVKKLALFNEITIMIISMMSCRSHHSDVDPLWLTFHLLKPARKICKKNSVLLPIVCPHWTFYSQQSSVLCHIPTRDVKNSCRMWAVWKKEASKPHSSTWKTPYHALHCFSGTWRRQKATNPCGEHNSMIFCTILEVWH